MAWTPNGYRHAPCIACQIAAKMGIRELVKSGRCHISDIGDVCSYHFHVLMEAFKDE